MEEFERREAGVLPWDTPGAIKKARKNLQLSLAVAADSKVGHGFSSVALPGLDSDEDE